MPMPVESSEPNEVTESINKLSLKFDALSLQNFQIADQIEFFKNFYECCNNNLNNLRAKTIAALDNSNLLDKIEIYLENQFNEESYSYIFQTLALIAGSLQQDSALLVRKFKIATLISKFEKCSVETRKFILNVVAAACPHAGTSKNASANQIEKSIVGELCRLFTTPDHKYDENDFLHICIILNYLANFESLAQSIIDSESIPNLSCKDEHLHLQAVDSQLDLLISLIPQYGFPDSFYKKNICSSEKLQLVGYSEFSDIIRPILIQYFESNLLLSYSIRKILYLLAFVSKYKPLKWNENYSKILNQILNLPSANTLAPYILLLLLNVEDPNVILNTDFIEKLKAFQINNKWYAKRIKFLSKSTTDKEYKTIDDFRDIDKHNITYDVVLKLLKVLKNTKPFDATQDDFYSKITNTIRALISNFVQLSPSEGKFVFLRLGSQLSFNLTLIGPEDAFQTSMLINQDIGAMIFYYIFQSGVENLNSLQDKLSKSEYGSVMKFPPVTSPDDMTTISGLLSKISNVFYDIKGVADYTVYLIDYKNERHNFAPNEQFFRSIISTVRQPCDAINNDIVMIIEEGKSEPTKLQIPKVLWENQIFTKIVELASEYFRVTGIRIIEEELNKRCYESLANLVFSFAFHSSETRAMYHCPFLFSFETRYAYLRTVFMDYENYYDFILRNFENKPKGFRPYLRTQITPHRDNIYEDGLKILRNCGQGTLIWDTEFDVATGQGPMSEFMQLLAQAFANDKEMWMENKENGLFPKSNVTKNFWEFGILCARAILLNSPIDIPLSDAFFALVRGDEVDISQYDEQVATSLSDKDSLIGLSYDMLGGPDKEITEENVDDFINFARNLSDSCKESCREFQKGFSTVIQAEALSLFTPKELSKLVCGESFEFTLEDFEKYVNITRNANEAMRTMLGEVLLEFSSEQRMKFIQFATGCNKLPIGGLANLNPRLELQLKFDEEDTLPTVSTCGRFLKMPRYSSKEIMKEKIAKALDFCGNYYAFS
ncbi:hypothetical protein TVAG_072040 [Trichomonas vaginalis G3]|uniref:HECT domain-containing protein n=1 Tax=Trichomonas vaginalis (strain ATCC PRA-98 / G3) TaxID=412133 RepID=A2D8A8_TRIV3|nr:negative regulation of histone ubiquitination [Trichomonas vaginalis G3]EAY23541.1 hypothetical protein TVAG_072040 [Trichomonas vaginalis G3]KAI5493963.1 negative regulation of histone ubiquitination [Trichomonas vaginalis G3]|eukprot:XP_001584527.1 hypothetical protein [Trichomonas vaginalis G3]